MRTTLRNILLPVLLSGVISIFSLCFGLLGHEADTAVCHLAGKHTKKIENP